MTDEEQIAFLELLLNKKKDLMQEGDFGIDPNRSDAATIPDEDTQPLNEMSQVIASRRNRNRTEEIEKIQAAIQRLQDDPDDFGDCDDCGEPIPIRRLEIMPWARFCVKCQSKRGDKRNYRRSHLGDFME